ncbi:MAG: hypothetical protein BWK73_04540 [Thiothrix lacustris]|uniref:Addiction module toxin RelE n=1 Tax=Thiothrix lacustris TaxID=525917 RepID=A0A1Y1QXG2_9GAMM|nr:MAG: hypothetical protein BWK73_04540 [Thiothrix lacustris]
MRHAAARSFWAAYRQLPEPIRQLARRNYQLLREDHLHPSLHFKEVNAKKRLWSARVGIHYRALALAVPEGYVWVWIGHHAVYDRLIK